MTYCFNPKYLNIVEFWWRMYELNLKNFINFKMSAYTWWKAIQIYAKCLWYGRIAHQFSIILLWVRTNKKVLRVKEIQSSAVSNWQHQHFGRGGTWTHGCKWCKQLCSRCRRWHKQLCHQCRRWHKQLYHAAIGWNWYGFQEISENGRALEVGNPIGHKCDVYDKLWFLGDLRLVKSKHMPVKSTLASSYKCTAGTLTIYRNTIYINSFTNCQHIVTFDVSHKLGVKEPSVGDICLVNMTFNVVPIFVLRAVHIHLNTSSSAI